jgi:ribonuclease Z
MAEWIVLGTAASVPDAEHDTVGYVLRGTGWAVLIDCGGSPLHKLARLGIEREELEAVVLTHGHADHIYGLPMLVQGLWLGGREAPLPIYGPGQTLDRARQLLELFSLAEREDMFKIQWKRIPLRENQAVLSLHGIELTASPMIHASEETVALRLDNPATGRSIVYSSDTEPAAALVRLAAGAGLLIHEAAGGAWGHSSPAQAAEVAREAGVERLMLTHYPVADTDPEQWLRQASEQGVEVGLARDGDVYSLS